MRILQFLVSQIEKLLKEPKTKREGGQEKGRGAGQMRKED